MVEDFGATVLPDMLGRLRREHPRFEPVTETGASLDLLRRLDAGSLDLVLAKRVTGRKHDALLCRQRLLWISPLQYPRSEFLPELRFLGNFDSSIQLTGV